MIEMSLGSLLVIATLLLTFFAYVASVSYRLGTLVTRVENNKNDIIDMQAGHATKDDVNYIKETLSRMDHNIGKLFDQAYKNVDRS